MRVCRLFKACVPTRVNRDGDRAVVPGTSCAARVKRRLPGAWCSTESPLLSPGEQPFVGELRSRRELRSLCAGIAVEQQEPAGVSFCQGHILMYLSLHEGHMANPTRSLLRWRQVVPGAGIEPARPCGSPGILS